VAFEFAPGVQGPATFHRAVGCGSSFGGSPLRQEIGLGEAQSIDRVQVGWPCSNTQQMFTDIPLNCMIEITEGAESYRKVPLP